MGRHRPKWRCIVCGRVRVARDGTVCAKCRPLTPWYGPGGSPPAAKKEA